MSQVRMSQNKRSRWAWPVIGLVLAVALGVIAYTLAPDTIRLLRRIDSRFITAGIPPAQLRWIFTAILFVIFLTITGFLVAIAVPRPKNFVKEADLASERKSMQDEKKRRKLLARKMASKMRDETKSRQQ